MQGWHTTFLGMRGLPRDISDFEMKAFFTFDGAERDAINARRGDSHKLGLALHIGFLRMSGRLLGAFRVIPVALWRHLGNELGIAAPEVASLRAMYERGRTLFDHQQVACTVLGFQWMSEHQRRSLVRELRDEVAGCDRDQLLVRARQWLYKNKLVIVHERAIRTLIAAALAQLEVETGTAIAASVDPATLDRWRASVSELRPDGQTQQSWLWAAPAKHSTRQISEVLERIDLLYTLDVHKHLADIPDLILRRYARRLVSRPPSAGAKIKEPARTVEVACFLRYCLFTTTDQLILMVQRRIADLWRQAAADVPATVNWAAMYKTLLGELVALSAQGAVPDAELRARLEALITETQKRKPPSRASLVREGLIDGIRPVRSLLVAIAKLPWQATGEHPAIEYLAKLQALYLKGSRKLPVEVVAPSLGMIWQVSISSPDRERAFQALEVATLFALRRAVRNGSVWIEHSLSFRGRARLFFTDERWQAESKKHYARLSLPSKAATFLKPLLARVTAGVDAVAAAARSGVLRVDDELHLSPLPAEDEDPEVTKLRAALDHRIGEVQLPEVILAVDAQVRFSWIMLGREPRSTDELLMVYAGIMAHGTSLTAVECARMIPQLSATSIRQAMRWARDERRLSQACQAVLEFMQRHPIAATWGRSDLASSDMMSMETTKRVWQARLDPRRNTPSIGIYSHVKDRWGIFHAQPFVLNERQAGVAIEGVIRQEKLETSQLAVDTHGYTDFAMSHARLLGFDLCPRLKELKQRHLFVPRGTKVPAEIAAVCEANVDVALIEKHWDSLVHLAASVMSGHASAVAALARFGSAAQGDPIYEAGVQLGRLLRTAFLADYFVKDAFRNELRRVLNRGEAVNALKRAIYTGRISPAQAKRVDEMQAVADALSLMANIVMAWNTSQMQAVLDRWSNRRQVIPPELIGKIAPTRLESINLRGVFRFPVDRYADQILPSRPNASITGTNG
uniref:Transposase for insertion sequence element IS1071 in transposon Tn5271 n=2 Tax=Comamonas testosteroni TaxID=285 RepID=TRA1_COMTE|nr:RecName: Full=Transposase for insertion sequence element IS1071 in transposon Tn5271 [Comamonas testosteroni]pir/A41290/ probable transposase (IS1071) - Alcaligenes sp. transposon Tn5271 [Alcaligenes sp.]AAA70396.1 transposase [Comamonas testosteroni]AAT81377.1 transposase TnpA [Comamonas testosteroni]